MATQKPVSQLGEGSATIEQMLAMDLDTLLAMSDAEIHAYIQPALKAVPTITDRNIITRPAQRVKVLTPEQSALQVRRGNAKATRQKSKADDLVAKVTALSKLSYKKKMDSIKQLQESLGIEEGLKEAEKRSVGAAEELVVKPAGNRNKIQL